jgi:hypothetical protein
MSHVQRSALGGNGYVSIGEPREHFIKPFVEGDEA